MLPPKGPGGRELCTPATVTPGSPTVGLRGATAMIPKKGASGMWMSCEKNATSRPVLHAGTDHVAALP